MFTKHRVVGGLAAAALLVLGLPAVAVADSPQDVGPETTAREAIELFKTI